MLKMWRRATRGTADDHQAAFQLAITEDPLLTVIFACVLDLNRQSRKNNKGVLKVEAPVLQGAFTLVGIVW